MSTRKDVNSYGLGRNILDDLSKPVLNISQQGYTVLYSVSMPSYAILIQPKRSKIL